MTKFITVNGETRTIKEWAEIKGVDGRMISNRLRAGWSEDEAVNKPKSETVGRPRKGE